jgi:hypothetical protein
MHINEKEVELIEAGILSAIEMHPDVREVLQSAADAITHVANGRATDDEIEAARDEYAVGSDNNVEIDDDAGTSRADDGTWVQAWVWLRNTEEEALEIGEDEQ